MILVYVLVTLYALCYQLQRPVEPFMVEKLVGDDGDAIAAYGYVTSFFSLSFEMEDEYLTASLTDAVSIVCDSHLNCLCPIILHHFDVVGLVWLQAFWL